ncbi:MAG: hypothetical protein C4K60_04095 [Ideonella sp. MAG2]|nr:MAG: hypothetical protein C4K60_04095 [Ideonella sp. MAG2]
MLYSKRLMVAVAAGMVGFSGVAAAQEQVTYHPLVGLGLTYGGDKVDEARYTDGTKTEITAGSLAQFYVGFEARFELMTAQINVGYHFQRANASNGSLSYERYPVEMLAHYKLTPQWRIGGGVRRISEAKLNGTGVASGHDLKLGASTGPVLEAEYLFSANSGLKARVAKDSYTLSTGKEVDGSHFGVMWTYYFN